MNFVFRKLCLLGLALAPCVARADGYSLELSTVTAQPSMTVWVTEDEEDIHIDLLPGDSVPLEPGLTYYVAFTDLLDQPEGAPALRADLRAVHEELDLELPFEYVGVLEDPTFPVTNVASPVGHEAWLEDLRADGIEIYFLNGDGFHSLTGPPEEVPQVAAAAA